MSVALVNYTTQDAYTSAGTILLPQGERVQVQVANAAVFYQLDVSREGSGRWSDEAFLAPTVGSLARRCSGIRFRSAVSGAPAQVSAELLNEADLSEGGDALSAFEGTVLASGAVGATLSLITGDVFWSTGTGSRAGALPCDGTLYDAVSDPTLENLWNKIGTTFGGTGKSNFAVPDLRGRMAVMIGTHADVDAIGDSDGVALAGRRPRHWHDVRRTDTNAIMRRTGGGVGSDLPQDAFDGVSASQLFAGPSGAPGDGSPKDAPAYLVLNAYIVK